MAERWLVIDDSSTIQRVIKLAFQGYDVQILEADSCQDAARELAQSSFSLVIADVGLAGQNGVKDFIWLQGLAKSAPFIILEGSYDHVDQPQFQGVGFHFFLKKPFDAAQLLAMTRQALGRALSHRAETVGIPPLVNLSATPATGGARSPFREEPSLAAEAVKGPAMPFKVDLGLQGGKSVDYASNPLKMQLDHDLDAAFRGPPGNKSSNQTVSAKAAPADSTAAQKSWDMTPRPAGGTLNNLLEPMLHEEMEKLVRLAVEDYCRKHFAGLARELIQRELERLTQERSRLLLD